MAYLNHLYSIPSEKLERCKSWKLIQTFSSKGAGCSHLLGYWPEFEPLRDALGRALDGGSVLHPEWQHRLRVPTVHAPGEVVDIHLQVEQAWHRTIEGFGELANDDWWKLQIEKCLDVFQHAASHREAVISILEQSMFIDKAHSTNEDRSQSTFLQRWLPWLVNQG